MERHDLLDVFRRGSALAGFVALGAVFGCAAPEEGDDSADIETRSDEIRRRHPTSGVQEPVSDHLPQHCDRGSAFCTQRGPLRDHVHARHVELHPGPVGRHRYQRPRASTAAPAPCASSVVTPRAASWLPRGARTPSSSWRKARTRRTGRPTGACSGARATGRSRGPRRLPHQRRRGQQSTARNTPPTATRRWGRATVSSWSSI